MNSLVRALFVVAPCTLALVACMVSFPERMARMSSGPTGCPPQQIRVENDQFDGTYPATWTAVCGTERWYCSCNAVGPATCSPARKQ